MTPVIHAPRRVPVALRAKLKEELERMKKLDIIEPVNEPSDWVSSFVMVQKPNGSLRVCLDPSDLNQAIKRHHLQLPTTVEILSQLSGACYFTKLDASNGYWQVRLAAKAHIYLHLILRLVVIGLNGCLMEYTVLQKYSRLRLLKS